MKKKISIISLILALMMLFSALPIMTASAEELPPELSIKGRNLAFESTIYIIFYVDAQNAQAEDVKLLVWSKPQETYIAQRAEKALTPVRTETINGKDYLRFEYRALAAKNMTDTIYAKAYTVWNGEEYYSELTSYSVLQYAYNKLGKTGTPTNSETLKNLLEKMLDYGASAQAYFKYNTSKSADKKFIQLSAEGGYLPDGTEKGFYFEGTNVVLTANNPDENMIFKGWKDASGAIFSTETTIKVKLGNSNAKYTAVFCPIDHRLSSTASPNKVVATTMKDGYTVYTCNSCGETFRSDYVSSLSCSQGLKYSKSGTTCTITGRGTCTDADIIIPEYIDGYQVTAISADAFKNDTTLRSVYMPDSITSIATGGNFLNKYGAFSGCTSLSHVWLSASLTSIGKYTFMECSSLSSIANFSVNIKDIGSYAFSNCSKLTGGLIYYAGSEEDWGNITVTIKSGLEGNGNNHFQAAKVKYNVSKIDNYYSPTDKIDYTNAIIALDGQKDPAYRIKIDINNPYSKNATTEGGGTVWLAQDNNGLYVYAEVIDSTQSNNNNDPFLGDRFQIYLDYSNNHDALGLAQLAYRDSAASTLGFIAVAPDGTFAGKYNFKDCKNVKVETISSADGYVVEMYIPFENKAIMSNVIGIGFEIENDTDGDNGFESIFFDQDGYTEVGYLEHFESLNDYEIEEKPLLTSFCLSDIHNQFSMLEPPYTIRGTATLAIDYILATEGKVDVAVIGGDYMSDYPNYQSSGWLPYEYYLGYKAKTLETFAQLAEGGKAIYVVGNHDYAQGEAATDGSYNSFDFYTDGMELTMGVLGDDDAFWVTGEHTGEDYLLAYYYEVNGIGFAGLSPDPDKIWSTQYTTANEKCMNDEALAWLDKKLDKVDPDGTKVIFVNCHFPIDSKNSAFNNAHDNYIESVLVPVFLGHNNLFQLYGHVESWYTDNTANNVYHYDKSGKSVVMKGTATNSNEIINANDRGFNTVYMGHFRPSYSTNKGWFYNDPVKGFGGTDHTSYTGTATESHPDTATPKIAQGMYIEVFEDRVVFTMKNFGIIPGFETGTELTSYTVDLKIKPVAPVKPNDNFFDGSDDFIW